MSITAVFLLHVLWVSLASALVVHKTISLHEWTDFEQFGFAPGGHIALKAYINPPQENVSLLVCTDKEFDTLSSLSADMEMGYCSPPQRCDYHADYRTPVDYRVQGKDRYRIFVLLSHSYSIIHLVMLIDAIKIY
jgi:hypothetical protein